MKKLLNAISVCGMMVMLKVNSVMASGFNPEDLRNPPQNDIFEEVKAEAVNAGQSAFGLAETIGTIVMVLSLMVSAICFGIYRSPMKKDENKGALIAGIAGGLLLFAAIPIVMLVKGLFE